MKSPNTTAATIPSDLHKAQAPTPPKERNPENEIYQVWKEASLDTDRSEIESRLLLLLRRHAAKVCWMVLHSYQPHLVEEIAQDAIMGISAFEERSSFSTWFHSRALNRCRNELRSRRATKEVSLDTPYASEWLQAPMNLEHQIIVRDLLAGCTPEEEEFLQLKVFDGYTLQEIATLKNATFWSIQQFWVQLRNKLRMRYHG